MKDVYTAFLQIHESRPCRASRATAGPPHACFRHLSDPSFCRPGRSWAGWTFGQLAQVVRAFDAWTPWVRGGQFRAQLV